MCEVVKGGITLVCEVHGLLDMSPKTITFLSGTKVIVGSIGSFNKPRLRYLSEGRGTESINYSIKTIFRFLYRSL